MCGRWLRRNGCRLTRLKMNVEAPCSRPIVMLAEHIPAGTMCKNDWKGELHYEQYPKHGAKDVLIGAEDWCPRPLNVIEADRIDGLFCGSVQPVQKFRGSHRAEKIPAEAIP